MKILCIGRNYAAHARELGNEIPTDPVLFIKPKTALLMPGKPVFYPEFTDDLQYECELVIRIDKNGKHISERHARKYYSEVSLGLDFTARDLQTQLKSNGLPWEISKAFDSSAAVGNFLKIPEDMDLQDLHFDLKINDETVQHGYTGDMICSINKIVEYASQFFTLNIGDLIFTGTPEGVGPVNVYDKLEGFLEGEKLFEVDIR